MSASQCDRREVHRRAFVVEIGTGRPWKRKALRRVRLHQALRDSVSQNCCEYTTFTRSSLAGETQGIKRPTAGGNPLTNRASRQKSPTLNTLPSHNQSVENPLPPPPPLTLTTPSQLPPSLLPPSLLQSPLPINKNTPPLPAYSPTPKTPHSSSRKLPLSISQLILAKTPRLQPNSPDPRVPRLFQNLLRNFRRSYNAQTCFARFA